MKLVAGMMASVPKARRCRVSPKPFDLVAITAVLLLSAGVTPLDGQPYTIATYAGGAPAPPVSASSLAASAEGNLYFVAGDGLGAYGSPAGSSSVFKIDPSGAVALLAGNSRTSFAGDGGPAGSASLNLPRAVAVDSAGNVFIVDTGNQRVRKVSPNGVITTVAGGGSAVLGDGGPATSGQLNYPLSIAVDSSGNLFIGEWQRVRKVSANGVISTIAGGGTGDPNGTGPATSVRLASVVSVAVDAAGNVFLTDQNDDVDSDIADYRIRKVTPDGTISSLPDIPGCCMAMTVDASGNLIVLAASAVRKISPSGAQTIVAGNGGYGPSSGDGEPATQAKLYYPTAIALDAAGNLYIADNLGRSVRKVTAEGIIRTIAAVGSAALPPSIDGGPATSAQLQLAAPGLATQSGLATDSSGNLYIAETAANRVRKVTPAGTITTIAGVGGPRCPGPSIDSCLPLGDGGPAIKAALSYPTSVAVDGAGNVFIADAVNALVRKVTPDGTISTVAGNGRSPSGPNGTGDGGPATNAALLPLGVATDRAGNLYVTEFNDVRRVSPDGVITTVVQNARIITASTVDAAGNIFVAAWICDDIACHFTIRKISPAGTATVIAGAADNPVIGTSSGDGGPALLAPLGYVSSLAVDAAGNLLLADLANNRIRKIDGNGTINTIGGNGVPGYSGDGGPARQASVNDPLGLAVDAAGNVYLSDFNQAVRILRPGAQP